MGTCMLACVHDSVWQILTILQRHTAQTGTLHTPDRRTSLYGEVVLCERPQGCHIIHQHRRGCGSQDHTPYEDGVVDKDPIDSCRLIPGQDHITRTHFQGNNLIKTSRRYIGENYSHKSQQHKLTIIYDSKYIHTSTNEMIF